MADEKIFSEMTQLIPPIRVRRMAAEEAAGDG
jgi:hypothetical protein